MDREAWHAAFHKVAKSRTQLSNWIGWQIHTHTQTWTHKHIQAHTHSDTPTLMCLDTHRHTHIDMQVQGHTETLNRYSLFSPSHSMLLPYLISSTTLHRPHMLSAWELCAYYFFCLGPSSFHLSSAYPGLWSLLSDTFPASLGCRGASCHQECMCIHLFHDTYSPSVQLFHKAGVSVCSAPSCVPRA